MDFGDVNLFLSQNLKNSILIYESQVIPGRVYSFRKKRSRVLQNGDRNDYWLCLNCEKIREQRGRVGELYCSIIVTNGRIMRNPDAGHNLECNGGSHGQRNAKQLDREARSLCKVGQKRPLEAHTHMNSEVNRRFENDQLINEIEANLPEYKSSKSGLKRWFQKGRILVQDAYDLPLEYRLTERGRYADEHSEFYNEQWLLCSDRQRRVVAFASNQDISLIHESERLIMDGTFKISPDGFVQLYTIHAWGRFGHEAIPCCHALMSSKTTESYMLLLSEIRARLETNHGSIGALRYVHTDFEQGAISAVGQVFPELTIIGCNFHFSQSLNRKLCAVGLRDAWTNDDVVGEWIGCIKALALLPIPLVYPAFNGILRIPPALNNRDQQLIEFRDYFENNWLIRRPATLWNHWANNGPRTTNHAEGYHNRLNLIEVRDLNLALRNSLHLLQPMHNRDQIRVRNLRRGIYQPKQRDATYADLDNRLTTAKQRLADATGHLWNFEGFDIAHIEANAYQYLMHEIHQYLRYVRHLVGKKSRVVLENPNQ